MKHYLSQGFINQIANKQHFESFPGVIRITLCQPSISNQRLLYYENTYSYISHVTDNFVYWHN